MPQIWSKLAVEQYASLRWQVGGAHLGEGPGPPGLPRGL